MLEFRPITPHIWRLNLGWDLRIPFYPPIPVAVWLVKEGEEWTIIDAGTPEAAATVADAVARFLGAASPACIALTHAHYDHGGALSELIKRWALPIWAHKLEADFVTGAKEYRRLDSQSLIFNLMKPVVWQKVWNLPVARMLNEGEAVAGMDVIHVPGHTPGMIAFHHRPDRAIICGDTFMNLGGKLSGPFAMASPDMAAARRSMQKLAALDFDTLLPSHDPSERGIPAEAVRQFVGGG
jgi:glyoxylase-like metal-dependent hydrolase (beta-lactamase superfamily II)